MTKIYLDLEDIVEIDVENKVLTVEPGMKMGTLTNKLIPLGWTIPVVPEMETLTIGRQYVTCVTFFRKFMCCWR